MGVKKSVLEKMTSKELENYIKPESKFVPEAIEYAFEILKSREYQFTETELEYWNSLKEKDIQLSEDKEVHHNYKRAANLIYISACLGVLKFILFGFVLSVVVIFTAICSLGFVFGLGYLAEKGYDWVKYILLFSFIVGFLLIISTMSLIDIILIIQTFLQLWALIILFRIPKNV